MMRRASIPIATPTAQNARYRYRKAGTTQPMLIPIQDNPCPSMAPPGEPQRGTCVTSMSLYLACATATGPARLRQRGTGEHTIQSRQLNGTRPRHEERRASKQGSARYWILLPGWIAHRVQGSRRQYIARQPPTPTGKYLPDPYGTPLYAPTPPDTNDTNSHEEMACFGQPVTGTPVALTKEWSQQTDSNR